MEQKRQRKKWFLLSFTVFQWENWPHKKWKSQQSNLPLSPPNALTLEETKEKHAAYLWQENKKERKGNMWEECLFLHKKWGSTYPSSSWWFFNLWQLCALFCVCMPEFICCTCLHELLPVHKLLYFLLIKNRRFIEWGPILLWVGPLFFSWVPYFEWGPSVNQ